MLEKPDFPDENISACLQSEYRLHVASIAFLPLGADRNTAVYRVVADDDTAYFLKLRSGVFDKTSVVLPKFLSDQGIAHIIAPLVTSTGQLWANLDRFKVILYPFVEGRNGYEVDLADHHWIEFGAALKRIHSVVVPPELINRLQRETFSPKWREIAKTFMARIEDEVFDDPVAANTALFLKAKRAEVFDLVERTERCARTLQDHSPEFVLCHSDLHAGNILIAAGGAFYLVDWDAPILAPKERDLMYAGGGQFGAARTPDEEERLFYRGYGQTQIDHSALAYYRYERIVEDIAVFCEQIFLTDDGGEDRPQALRYLMSNFEPNGIIEIAYRADKTISITPEDPASADAVQLLAELSDALAAITGATGRSSFDPVDVRHPNALFVIARDATGQAIGCGGFRPLYEGIAEVKRMYARPATSGVGAAILAYLEARAAELGYQAVWLETRLVNERAVRFYEKHGYARIPNFGKYRGNPRAVCFEKRFANTSDQKVPPAI